MWDNIGGSEGERGERTRLRWGGGESEGGVGGDRGGGREGGRDLCGGDG